MPDIIPFARPFLGKEEEDAVLRVLRSHWLTTGPEALAFEKEFARFLNLNEEFRAFAVNSATSGLHLALEAAGAGPGDVVLVPSYTFAATAEAARYLGADVAFIDVAPGSFLMDPAALDETASRLYKGKTAYKNGGPAGRPRAAIPVHFAGLPCDMKAVVEAGRRYDMAIIEDAAHSFPSRLPDGAFAGTLADIGVFSFYATKTLATGEGGMIVTANSDYAKRISLMRLHGIDRPVWNRYTDKTASWYYEVAEAGYKYNLPDLLAAIGRVQLGRAGQLLDMRRSIAARYDAAFSDSAFLITPPTSAADARHLYPLRLAGTRKRDETARQLQERGIGVSVHFIPLHVMPYYVKRYGLSPGDFPETMRAFESEISLPIWPGMTEHQTGKVIEAVRDVYR